MKIEPFIYYFDANIKGKFVECAEVCKHPNKNRSKIGGTHNPPPIIYIGSMACQECEYNVEYYILLCEPSVDEMEEITSLLPQLRGGFNNYMNN